MNRTIFLGSVYGSFVLLFIAMFMSRGLSSDVPVVASEGYGLWRVYGCENCHTLFGQGGNYAPDLTHIYALRGEQYLRDFLVNPSAFHPNQRLMPRFAMTQNEMAAVIAMLRWTSIDAPLAQQWPPNPIQVAGSGGLDFASSQADAQFDMANPEAAQGRRVYSQRCASCHSIEDGVIIVGPSFWNIANTAATRVAGTDAAGYIRNSILYPSDYVVSGFGDVMQKNFAEVLSSTDIDAVITYLLTFDGEE